MINDKIDICYLCGKELDKDIDYDHVPPKQFYANIIRKAHNLNLSTLATHKDCNKSYQHDEDYFVNSLGPLAMESYPGKALWDDLKNRRRRPEGEKLFQQVFKEFDPRPSGLILPGGKVLKRFDGKRIWRVVWKITRGLFFKEYGRILPENTPRKNFFSGEDKPSPEFDIVRNAEEKGDYPLIFAYKHIHHAKLPAPAPDDAIFFNGHLWFMLFWDKLIMGVGFHDPTCECPNCNNAMQS